MTDSDTSTSLSRRAVLAGAAASTASTAGCLNQLQSIGTESEGSQLSVDIKALPADSDPYGIQIAQQLRANLEAVGVDVRLSLISITQFTRQVLLNHDFDIYVGQAPFVRPPDPDALYPLFRSEYATSLGWQNPFGLVNGPCDDLLAAQRSHGSDQRQQDVRALQEELARAQPITPLVFPDRLTGVRTDRFTGWDPEERDPAMGGPTRPHNLLLLDGVEGASRTLRLVTANDRLTSNRNPISAAYKQPQSLLDLVYDSVALEHGTEQIPWLAREFTWVEGTDTPEVEIQLREGVEFHDGEQLSAYDVGFTYEFLADTSLGTASRPVPAERFSGEVSTIEEVTVEDAHRLRLSFTDTRRAVAERALTVPILPAHIWRGRTRLRRESNRTGQTTEALTTNNGAAVGSGPLRFETADSSVVEFSLFDQHFLWPSGTVRPGKTPGPNETGSGPDWLFPFFGGEENTTNESAANSTQSATNSTTSIMNSTQPATNSTTPITNSTDSITNSTAPQPGPGSTTDTDTAPPPEPYGGIPAFDTITVESVSSTAVIGLIESGGADATLGPIGPQMVSIAENSPGVELVESQPNTFYHLGFNTRREPFRNPNLRGLVARLVHKPTLAEESFDGYGTPAASPLARTDWVADSLQWDEETDPMFPFLGTDGELSVEEARDQFRSLGYEYNSDNQLVS